jgi:hypothetical protein
MINGENFSVINELLSSVAIVYGWKGFYKPTYRKTVTVPKDTLQQFLGDFLLQKDTLTISSAEIIFAYKRIVRLVFKCSSLTIAISLFVKYQMLFLLLSGMLQEKWKHSN